MKYKKPYNVMTISRIKDALCTNLIHNNFLLRSKNNFIQKIKCLNYSYKNKQCRQLNFNFFNIK